MKQIDHLHPHDFFNLITSLNLESFEYTYEETQ